jgi:hypothetical protein
MTQALTVVRDDMKFLNADDKRWILSKTIEQSWPFPAYTQPLPGL